MLALHLRAYGNCKRDDSSTNTFASSETEKTKDETKLPSYSPTNLLESLVSAFRNTNNDDTTISSIRRQSTNLITCPVDFIATVDKASIFLGSKSLLDIPVSGTGYLRVLYADPKLRIFISPNNKSSAITGDRWEQPGLKVVQVCVDHIDPTFQLLL